MEFLRRLILQTQSHLKGLTLSQRLAIGSCVALIAVSLLWLMQWAAEPDLVPLLDQPLTAAQTDTIAQRLGAMGVEYKLVNEAIMVSADKRIGLLVRLTESKALPEDVVLDFNRLVEQNSPWLPAEEQNWRRTVALGNELAKALRYMNGVEEARVFIDRNTKRTVSGPPVVPKASVFVKLTGGQPLDERRTEAIARFVCFAVSGLDMTQVAVTDARTGRSMSVRPPNELLPFDDLEDRQKKEQYFANKIQTLLANIPGLLVAVHAELDPESRKTTRQTYTKPLPVSEKSETMTQNRGEPVSGQGVVPNTSKVVTPSAVTDRTEKESNEATYETRPESVVESVSPWHGLKSLTASVNVPRSYLAAIFKQANAGKDPTDAELNASAAEELKKITEAARAAIAAKDEGSVVVNWFHDEAMMQMGGIAEAAVAGTDMMTMVRTYGGRAGLGALAVGSLFMMLMMVRKVSEGPVLPGEEPPQPQIIRIVGGKAAAAAEEEAETLTVGMPTVGEAEAREQLLVGREVDDSTLRIQQVVDQVSDMIRNDPEISVGILQRWIDSEAK